jgi:histidine ammonia-lyase
MNKNTTNDPHSPAKNHQIGQKMTVQIRDKEHFSPKSLEFLIDVSTGNVQLQWENHLRDRAQQSHMILVKALDSGQRVYGVNTGFGEQGTEFFDHSWIQQNQENLLNYHTCGVGGFFTLEQSRTIVCARIFSLAQGYSGVRPQLIDRLIHLFNQDAIPQIPRLGSVGASGDLTPLASLAGFLAGKGTGWLAGQVYPADQILQMLGIEPWTWEGKEVLAIMNGTSVMTGLAGLEWVRLKKLYEWVTWILVLGSEALNLPEEPYSTFVQAVKHHQGPISLSADILRASQLDKTPISERSVSYQSGKNIQPRYSFRCAPQALGVLWDTLEVAGQWLANEFHSANDNPLVDTETERIYHGGNFFGGHVSAACDYLRISLAHVAQLIDRQVQLLLDGKENQGLGANLGIPETQSPDKEFNALSYSEPPNFGLKALGITTSALAAEIHHLSAPALVLSRPTESGNQDIVTMGTISARKLGEAVELLGHLVAHGLVCGAQAWEIRFPNKKKSPSNPFSIEMDRAIRFNDPSNISSSDQIVDLVRKYVPNVKGSRPLQRELEKLVAMLSTADIFAE